METVHIRQSSRKKKSTVKTNIIIAVVVHVLVAVAGVFWAAHEGMLGAKLQNLAVFMVPKDKKAEDPKKVEQKVEARKVDEPAKIQQAKAATPAPPRFIAPRPANELNVAPPPVIGDEGLNFSEDPGTDPVRAYSHQVEDGLRAGWDRPTDLEDSDFIAEVELRVDAEGRISGYTWKKGSGNPRWDKSVKQALARSKGINRPPPKGFPETFLVRFDVQPAAGPLVSRAD